jgi:hypothetical protein
MLEEKVEFENQVNDLFDKVLKAESENKLQIKMLTDIFNQIKVLQKNFLEDHANYHIGDYELDYIKTLCYRLL